MQQRSSSIVPSQQKQMPRRPSVARVPALVRRKSTAAVRFGEGDYGGGSDTFYPQRSSSFGAAHPEKCDAVTMTVESDFPGKTGIHGSLFMLRSGADAGKTGSRFIQQLMGKSSGESTSPSASSVISQKSLLHQQQQQQKQSAGGAGSSATSDRNSPVGSETGAYTAFSESAASAQPAAAGGAATRDDGDGGGTAIDALSHATVTTTSSKKPGGDGAEHEVDDKMNLQDLIRKQLEREFCSKPQPRLMMRPSALADPSLFPKMKIAGVRRPGENDEDDEDDLNKSESSDEKKKKKQQQQQQGKGGGGDEDKKKKRGKDAGAADGDDTLLDDVAEDLARTVRLKRAQTLPDEVLQLVRKLRSAADVIGSSEGSPPPDALREVAVHSASLARFVSSWTLQQISEKDQYEASMQRGWLADAARELKARANDVSWSTTHHRPAAVAAISSTTTGAATATTGAAGAMSPAAAGKSRKHHQIVEQQGNNNSNNNNNSNSGTTNATWPRSFAAISATLGPWILSTLYLMMDSLLHCVQCDRGALFVPDDSGRAVSAVLVGAGGIARPIRVERGRGVVGEVFRSGVAVNVLSTESKVGNKRNEEIFSRDTDNATGFFTRNLLAVPVFAVGRDLIGEAGNKSTQQQQQLQRENEEEQQQMLQAAAAESGGHQPNCRRMNPLNNNSDRASAVGRGRVVAVIELINKLVPVDGEFTPADEMLVAQIGSVVASMLAACGGVLQLGTEAALAFSAEQQAKLLAMRPAAIKARNQVLTATTGGCDSEETSTGRYSFTQVLNLHEDQRARERNIALQLKEQSSATDLSRCGASNEKIQEIFRVGGASTKVLRIGGDGGTNAEVERTLQDMTSFVGRIESAWAGTRERCVIAESEAAESRTAYTKLEHELIELRKLAHQCGIIHDPSVPSTSVSRLHSAIDSGGAGGMGNRAASSAAGATTTAGSLANNNNNNSRSGVFELRESSSVARLRQEMSNDGNETTATTNRSDLRTEQSLQQQPSLGNLRRHSHMSDDPASSSNPPVLTDDQAVLERLLHSGDPSDSWESAKGAFLDYFHSKTSGYKKAAAVDAVQHRNLEVMRERAAVSNVGSALKNLEHRELAEQLMRAADLKTLSASAASTRHRDRTHHRHTIKEKACVDPLSLSCQKMQDMVAKHEAELAEMVARQQAETRALYESLLHNSATSGALAEQGSGEAGVVPSSIGMTVRGPQGFLKIAKDFLTEQQATLRGK